MPSLSRQNLARALLACLLLAPAGCGRSESSVVAEHARGLKSPDPGMRYYAARSLGLLGPAATAAMPTLCDALKDPDASVRAGAAWAMAEIGPGASKPVPALLEALKDADPLVRAGAAYSLPSMGPEARSALPPLKIALRDKDEQVRKEAAAAIRKIEAVSRYASSAASPAGSAPGR